MDPDELFHPQNVAFRSDASSGPSTAGSGLSIVDTLRAVPDEICMVNFLNYEGLAEQEDIEKRFQSITLFKGNSKFMTEEASAQRLVRRMILCRDTSTNFSQWRFTTAVRAEGWMRGELTVLFG